MSKDGPVRTKSVNHPGNPARPMLPNETEARSLAIGVLDKIVRSVTSK